MDKDKDKNNFENLPADWDGRSLDDPDLLGCVVDLFVRHADRQAGSLLALLANEELRLVQPVMIDDIPVGCDQVRQHEVTHRLTQIVGQVCPGGGLALAVARRGMVVQTHWDLGWRSALALACQDSGVVDLGCYLATPAGVVRLDDSAAAA